MTDKKLRIGLLSFSSIADDPRLRKQGDSFKDAGWEVLAIGVDHARAPVPDWPCFTVGDEPNKNENVRTDLVSKGLRFVKRQTKRLNRVLREPNLGWSEAIYWSMNARLALIRDLAMEQDVDLWLANDWLMLPIARHLARHKGTPFAYDTHELAVDEYAQQLRFRIVDRPIIRRIEREGIKDAAFTSCVSQGIANRLQEVHDLATPPQVIRNAPPYYETQFRPVGDAISVLYHGIVAPGRGLEACIASVQQWRPEFQLTIRGPASAEYAATLEKLILENNLSGRVTLEPPIPVTDLVRAANRHDVGLFALEGHSLQNVYVLPNKFFEYMMAGLALCVSNLPEMAAILRHHRLGSTIETVTPEAIAEAVNSLTRETIDGYKHASLEAAKTHNWEFEVQPLLTAAAEAAKHYCARQSAS